MPRKVKIATEIIRVSGRLKEVLTFRDEKGNIVDRMVSPLMVEFYPRDLMQVVVGSAILAIPVAFTEETWNLGQTLPFLNVILIMALSLLFIGTFVYYNFYKGNMTKHKKEFAKRVLSIYVFSFIVVAVIMTIIQRAPWASDSMLALKRVMLVSFPASMSAAVSDMIK
jgi:uncharacterized membrane protein